MKLTGRKYRNVLRAESVCNLHSTKLTRQNRRSSDLYIDTQQKQETQHVAQKMIIFVFVEIETS
jgi:hypothetical protein